MFLWQENKIRFLITDLATQQRIIPIVESIIKSKGIGLMSKYSPCPLIWISSFKLLKTHFSPAEYLSVRSEVQWMVQVHVFIYTAQTERDGRSVQTKPLCVHPPKPSNESLLKTHRLESFIPSSMEWKSLLSSGHLEWDDNEMELHDYRGQNNCD